MKLLLEVQHLGLPKAVQQARLGSLLGRFWSPGLMFDTPALCVANPFCLLSLFHTTPIKIVVALKAVCL